jgi:hypothetical protein
MNEIYFWIDISFLDKIENEIHNNLDIDLESDLFKYDSNQNFISSDLLDFISDELKIHL